MAFRTKQRKKLRIAPNDGAAKGDIVTLDDFIEILEEVGEWRRVRSTDEAGNKHEGYIRVSLLEEIGPPEPLSEEIDEIGFVMALTAAARDFGVNRDYLAALACVESELKNSVDVKTQATGPFQYTPTAWNKLVDSFGSELGIAYGDIVDSGMQATFAAKQAAIATEILLNNLKRRPNSIELYLAHRLSLPVALRVLSCASDLSVEKPIRDFFKDSSDLTMSVEDVLDGNDELLKEGGVFRTTGGVLNIIKQKLDIGLKKAAEIVGRLPADEQSGHTVADGEETRLGELSAKYESRDPGDIGQDSTGGFSYGTYQIATRTGTMKKFLNFLQDREPVFANRLQDAGGADAAGEGTAAFKNAWKDLAMERAFVDLQHHFIKSTHYDILVLRLQEIGLNLESRSMALKNVVWSVAVQHGPNTPLIKNALFGLQPGSMSDQTVIDAIYVERSKVDIYFESSTPKVKASVANRFKKEHADAIAMLA